MPLQCNVTGCHGTIPESSFYENPPARWWGVCDVCHEHQRLTIMYTDGKMVAVKASKVGRPSAEYLVLVSVRLRVDQRDRADASPLGRSEFIRSAIDNYIEV